MFKKISANHTCIPALEFQNINGLTVQLRAERSGHWNGRIYTITVQTKDASGNASTKTTTVKVPK